MEPLQHAAAGLVQDEPDVRLVSYQSNQLTAIEHLEGLPSLAFLDCFSNSISSLSGLAELTTLRVLMLGRNQICDLSGTSSLLPQRLVQTREVIEVKTCTREHCPCDRHERAVQVSSGCVSSHVLA